MDSSKEWNIDNLPNRLTMFRLLMIPVVYVCLMPKLYIDDFSWPTLWYKYCGHLSAFIFLIAAATDGLDGYIARKRKIVTIFGSFLDPIADKFLVVTSLILLMALERATLIVGIVLILREMFITSLRLLALERGVSIPVGPLGKFKTLLQMTAIPLLLIYDQFLYLPCAILGKAFLYLACIFSVLSALRYSMRFIIKLKAQMLSKRGAK